MFGELFGERSDPENPAFWKAELTECPARMGYLNCTCTGSWSKEGVSSSGDPLRGVSYPETWLDGLRGELDRELRLGSPLWGQLPPLSFLLLPLLI